MGKLKKSRRNQKGRANPVAKKDGRGASTQEIKDQSTRQNKIVPLIGQLSSSAPNDRSVALNAITVLSEDSRMRQLLLKEKLIPTLMTQTLNDSNDELVVETFGLLRNLTIEEGYEVAKYLWRSNIWAAIETALAKIQSTFQFLAADKKLDQKRLYMFYDFVENIFSLMVLIASCSQDLYKNVYTKIDSSVDIAVDILNWNCEKLRSVKLFSSALDFLYEFSSNSAEFVNRLATMPTLDLNIVAEAVHLPAQYRNTLGKVYVEGLRFHFMEVGGNYSVTSKNEACAQILLKLLGFLSHIDVSDIQKKLAVPDNAADPLQKQPQSQEQVHPQDIDIPFGGESIEKAQARADLQAIEITVDLVTSICELLAINDQNPLELVLLDDNVTSVILTTVYASFLYLLRFDRESGGALHLVSKLLVAFNNICWLFLSASTILVDYFAKIPELWQQVEFCSADDWELQNTCLSIMWALAKVMGPEVRNKISVDKVQSILTKCADLISSNISENDQFAFEYLLSAAGFLGSIAQVIENVDITGQVAEFLLALITHFSKEEFNLRDPKSLEIPIESLNLLYDIFGDAEYSYDEPIFVGRNFLERLEQIEPEVRAFYKKIDKNWSTELKLRAEEAWMNLKRFIEYKKTERQ